MSNNYNKVKPDILCSICRFSHNTGNKHVYTKKHKQNVNIILSKSLFKIKEMKKDIENVIIHDEEWEKDVKFWCYFCNEEYLKHYIFNGNMIQCLGIVDHFSGASHCDSVKKFFKVNRLTSEKLSKYWIKRTEFLSFLEKIPKAESRHLKKMKILNQQFIDQINEADFHRKEMLNNEMQIMPNNLPESSSSYVSLSKFDGNKTKCDVSQISPSLEEKKVPPWLIDDDEINICQKIDVSLKPSIEDLIKHMNHQKRKKLSSLRIGANFNRTRSFLPNWLPSYSRIWNQGRRKQSMIQFRNETKKIKHCNIN